MTVVLLVEDDDLQANLISAVLKRMDCKVIHTIKATEGLELAREHQPDLILLDLSLPDMYGVSAIEVLKGQEITKAIPIIVITGSEFGVDKTQSWAAGCEGYIHKPFRVKQLREYLSTFINAQIKRNDTTV
jgi:two-component system cell cycle response regulator DivK